MTYPIASRKENALNILGISLHPVDVADVHQFIDEVILRGQKALVLNLNINCVVLSLKYSWLHDFINYAQLVFCDGDGVRWGLKVLGLKPPPKITYDRWIWQLAEYAESRDHSFYFLGGKSGVAEDAGRRLRSKYPKLRLIGYHHGYFEKTGLKTDQIVAEINRCKPDILIVGFGMPAQEKWLLENWQKLEAHIFLTGGAVFDCASGRIKRTPSWMIKAHMEWLFRFIQEPKRKFKRYIIRNPYFFYRIFREKFISTK
jgi:N-acetylglucosaminyldiphosphoundecaprenol N-acetyl-beta-D-mannosaminyltransferase